MSSLYGHHREQRPEQDGQRAGGGTVQGELDQSHRPPPHNTPSVPSSSPQSMPNQAASTTMAATTTATASGGSPENESSTSTTSNTDPNKANTTPDSDNTAASTYFHSAVSSMGSPPLPLAQRSNDGETSTSSIVDGTRAINLAGDQPSPSRRATGGDNDQEGHQEAIVERDFAVEEKEGQTSEIMRDALPSHNPSSSLSNSNPGHVAQDAKQQPTDRSETIADERHRRESSSGEGGNTTDTLPPSSQSSHRESHDPPSTDGNEELDSIDHVELPEDPVPSAPPISNSPATGNAPERGEQEQRVRHRAPRVFPADFQATRDDYFSRHPPGGFDGSVRRGGGATSSASKSQSDAASRRDERTRGPGSIASNSTDRHHQHQQQGGGRQERGHDSGSEYSQAILSPALSAGTSLSAGISIGATMGATERIFPIRSVVAPSSSKKQGYQTQPQATPSANSASGSTSTTQLSPTFQSGPQPPIRRAMTGAPSPSSSYFAQQPGHTGGNAEDAPDASSHASTSPYSRHGGKIDFPEYGTDYTRASPIPEESKSDFSFAGSTGSNERRTKGSGQAQQGASEEGATTDPDMTGKVSLERFQGGATGTGTSSVSSNATSRLPSFRRTDSNATGQTTSSGPGALSSPSSYPPTSRYSYSDDSDPTARKGEYSNSTGPSTVMSSHMHTGRTSASIDSPPFGSSSGRNSKYVPSLADIPSDDIEVRARQAYEKGEAEEGPSVGAGQDHLGTIKGGQRLEDGLYVNVRFEHQETDDGHTILTGRKGELLKCEDEPIHIPGAIQDYGVLIAVEEDANGHLVVQQVSENSGRRLGLPPKYLFSLNCFTEALDEEQADNLRDAIDILDDHGSSNDSGDEGDDKGRGSSSTDSIDAMTALTGGNNFQLSGYGIPGSGLDGEDSSLEWSCWCTVHRPHRKTRPRLAIIEFELENDIENPISTERSQQEIDEDRAKEQARSLFTEEDTEDGAIPGVERVSNPTEPASSLQGMLGQGVSTKSGLSTETSSTIDQSSASSTIDQSSASSTMRPGHGHSSAASTARETETGSKSGSAATGNEGLVETATQDEINSSTKSRVRPMRALRRLRQSKSGGNDIMKLFSVMGQINQELNRSQDLQTSLEITAGVVAEVTGFHRVMIYQFDDSWNGQVVAELVDYKQTRDLYRGLHFPASDIPAQARELYKINKVRLLYDRDQPTARLVCRNLKELETPLDLTHSHLRAMSPIHIKYLANMGVRASMSISILSFGQLWGLISCHTYGRYGQRVSFPARQLCRIIGDSVSRNIERLSYAQRLQSRKLINTIPTNSNPGGYIIAKAEDLLGLFDAEFGVISIGDEAKLLGSLENSQEVLAILEYLRVKKFQDIQITTNVVSDFPDLDYPSGFQVVAGMLMVPLARAGQDFIAFFRRGQLQHVHWAGNPYDKVIKQAKNSKTLLEPRKSFKIWSETVMGKCKSWTDENIETASVLRLVYGKFIEVWRQREAAMTSSRLTTLLLSNASHEVRTPLNHIINYLEMALEGPLDDDTRESLVRSHSASRALVHVINDLLDLTRTETGQPFFLQDPLDLRETLEDAVAIHRMEAQRNGLQFEIIENPSGTPQTLLGDRGKIRQIVANATANAVKHTKQGKVTIEWGELPKDTEDPLEASPDTIKIGIAVIDTGVGIPEEQLEEMFRIFEEVDTASDEQPREGHLGLGLAVVARIVSGLGGQMRVESKVGHGSKFTFVLHFRLPGPDQEPKRIDTASESGTQMSRPSHDSSMRPRTSESKDEPKPEKSKTTSSKGTGSSLLSAAHSHVQSQKSGIDSLVEAISSNPDRRNVVIVPSSPQPPSTSTKSQPKKAGQVPVEASRTPLRPMKMDEDVAEPTTQADLDEKPQFFKRPALGTRRTSMYRSLSGGLLSHGRTYTNTNPAAGSTAAAAARTTPGDQNAATKPKARRQSASSGPQLRPLRIMIVEDDAINRSILFKKLTKDYAHEVAQTVHGEDAVRLYSEDSEFDLILMDLQMPICDGYTATRRIREIESHTPRVNTFRHPGSRQIPIFAVSASLLESQKQQLLDCGFSGFILKPVSFVRMQELALGALDPNLMLQNYYQAGRWEKGGWLYEAVGDSAESASMSVSTSASNAASDAVQEGI